MRKSPDDEMTYYFVIIDDGNNQRIQAWSDKKDYVKYYMDFHKCDKMHLKKMHGLYSDIIPILEENFHDEIGMFNIFIRNSDPNRKKHQELKSMVIPATNTEIICVSDEIGSFMSSIIEYRWINEMFPYLKKKYQRSIYGCLLGPIMEKVIHEKASPITSSIQFDQVMVMASCFPDHFGQ